MARDSLARRNAALDAACTGYNSGYLRIYSGTRPANADTALFGNTLLAELRFGATAWASATGGSATANALTQDSESNAAGVPTFARALASDGTTALCDFSVGKTGGTEDLLLNSTNEDDDPYITAGVPVSVSSLVRTFGVGS